VITHTPKGDQRGTGAGRRRGRATKKRVLKEIKGLCACGGGEGDGVLHLQVFLSKNPPEVELPASQKKEGTMERELTEHGKMV